MGDKKKILVVDDNPNFTSLMQLAFEDDYNIILAGDGQQGMDKAFAEVPDLIISDVMMPNVSGVEMLRMLLADETTRKIPVLVTTGSHFNDSVRSLFQQEPNVKGFLSKITPLDEVIKLVKGILGD